MGVALHALPARTSGSGRGGAATQAVPTCIRGRHDLGRCAAHTRSNKDTVFVDHLSALSAGERLTLTTNLGTLALLAEIMTCWLFGEMDPLGEACGKSSGCGLAVA